MFVKVENQIHCFVIVIITDYTLYHYNLYISTES